MSEKPLILRDITDDDLPIFFKHQQDEIARQMAAFTSKDPTDHEAFFAHWAKIRSNKSIIIRTIVFDRMVVGHIVSFVQFGEREISYWIDRAYWGKGIATRVLQTYLSIIEERPLFARVAKDNIGSRRVLEKCGFTIIGEDKGFANARDAEIEEFILKLV